MIGIADIHAGLDSAESGVKDDAVHAEDIDHPESAEIYIVPEEGNDDFRQKIIKLK